MSFLPAYDARGRALGLLLNGVVELVAGFSKQMLGDADRLKRFGAVGERLMHQHVFPSLHGGDRNRRMQMVRRHDFYSVQAFFLLQQLSEIGIFRTGIKNVVAKSRNRG